jgi:hypothetical protein
MSERYIRADWFTQHVFNLFVGWLTSIGISVYGSRVLAVRGRSSGEWRTNPVNLLDYNGARTWSHRAASRSGSRTSAPAARPSSDWANALSRSTSPRSRTRTS